MRSIRRLPLMEEQQEVHLRIRTRELNGRDIEGRVVR